MERFSSYKRETEETRVSLNLGLDGTGKFQVNTEIPFFDHMLAQLIKHSNIDLSLTASGDLEVDLHHTVEDVGIVLGKAFNEALGKGKGIQRFGFALVPMDDVLCRVAVDISGRPYLYTNLNFTNSRVGIFPTELIEEFLRSFAYNAGITLHVELLHGKNTHHQIEAIFKALGQSLKMAIKINSNQIPSTKGVI